MVVFQTSPCLPPMKSHRTTGPEHPKNPELQWVNPRMKMVTDTPLCVCHVQELKFSTGISPLKTTHRRGQRLTYEGSEVRSWNIVCTSVLHRWLRKRKNAMCRHIKCSFSHTGPGLSCEPCPRLAGWELRNPWLSSN